MSYQDMLIASEVQRAEARIADIELGLTDPDPAGRRHWIRRGRDRIRILEADRMDYGLLPHEEDELRRLEALVGRDLTVGDIFAVIVTFLLCVALVLAASFGEPR